MNTPTSVRWAVLAGILAAVAAGGLTTAGCGAAAARPDTPAWAVRADAPAGAAETGFFASSRTAVPLRVYDQPLEAHRTDRVAPIGSEARAAATRTSLVHTPDAAAGRKAEAAGDQPPMTPVRLAAVVPPEPFVGGGVVAYNLTIGVIPVGPMMGTRATVSADRRYVQLDMTLQNVTGVQFRQVPIVTVVP